MDIGRLVKWAAILALVLVVVKVVVPWVREQGAGTLGRAGGAPSGEGDACTAAAQRASETWGRSLRQFVNPPYDPSAWGSFRGDVDSQIRTAERACACMELSCKKTQAAMRTLRDLVSEMDTAIRNGSAPPADLVQRQESVDSQIDEAAQLVKSGR
jgi:hypothetical protein